MAVVEYHNYTNAAKATFTSQSNISKQIFQLEDELGVKLFDRYSVGVKLTPAGEYLYNGLKNLLPKMEHLFEEVKNIEPNSTGLVRLGYCESMDINRIIPNLLHEIKMQEPSLEVEIESYSIEKLLEVLSTESLDIGLIFSVLDINFPGVQRLALTRTNPLIYFSKEHPLFKKQDLKPEDFRDEIFVRYSHKMLRYDQFIVLPFVPKKIIEANSLNAVLPYVESSLAVAVLGQSQYFLGKDNIATIEITNPDQMIGTDAVWSNTNSNPSLQCFLSYLFKYFK